LLTEAAFATSSSLVAAKPRVTNNSSAARAISGARSSGRRVRGKVSVDDAAVLTDWSVSIFRYVEGNKAVFKAGKKRVRQTEVAGRLFSFAFPPPQAGVSAHFFCFRWLPVGP
jgi:hypothetical protein